MRKILFSTLALLTILASSCQREYILEDLDNPLPVDSTQTDDPDSLSSDYGGLLKKMIYYTEGTNDTGVSNFIYDAEERLVEYNDHAKNLANPTEENYRALIRITREPGGIIKEINLVTRLFETPDDDEPHYDIKYQVHYDKNLSQYKYAILTGLRETSYDTDSIVFEYSGSRMTRKIIYGTNSMNIPSTTTVNFTYDDKNNVTRHYRLFEYEGNTRESSDITYTYDNKIAAGKFGELYFFMDEDVFFLRNGENNLVHGVDRLGGSSFPIITYTYNLFNKPAQSQFTEEDFDEKETVIYLYSK